MRRKLFISAVMLLITVFLICEAFPDIWVPAEAKADETIAVHSGTVEEVREKNGKWIIDVKDDRGFLIRLNYYDDPDKLIREGGLIWELPGTYISFSTRLTIPDPRRNPHCFDYRKYLRSEDVYLTGTVKKIEIISEPCGLLVSYKRFLYGLKYSFRVLLPEEDRGLIMGTIFGDTGDLNDETYEDFRRNGTAHILAVSGLHIGILYSIYEKLTGGRTDHGRLIILLFLLYTYGVLTGWRPSVVRAEMMILLKVIAKVKGLRYDSLTAMSLAAIILIIRNPYVIYGLGFQMSFLAIMAIKIVMKAIPEKIPDTLAQTLAVNITLTLYQAYVFNYITPLAVLINIPILYLAGISIPLSFGTFVIFAVSAVFGAGLSGDVPGLIPDVILVPSVSIGRLLIKANELMSLGGASSLDVISPPAWIMIFVITSLFFASSELADLIRIRKDRGYMIRCFIAIAAVSVIMSIVTYEPIERDQILFVDVGQGACTHLKAGGLDVLIDGGGSRDRNVGEKTLKPYLLKNGARDLDLALATHEDTDHIQGLRELLDCFHVKNFRVGCVAGENYSLCEGVTVKVLWPLTISEEDKQSNEESSVFMVSYRGVRILITGDLGEDGEKEMIRFYESRGELEKLRADVLNVGHHGSKYSTCDDFLDAVRPKLAVIQVGRNNYGHPSPDTLERLAAHGVKVLRNDEVGAVGLRIDKHGIKAVHVMIGQ